MSFCGYSKMAIAMCLFITTLGLQNGMASVRYRDKRFTKVDICYETLKTLEMVGQCPMNASILQERSLQKTCHLYPSCSGMPLVYHCANYKDGLAKVCAPRDQITGFCCALYDEGVKRVVEDYNRPCSNCSFRYPSDNIVKYPQCVSKSEPHHSNEDAVNADDDAEPSGSPCNKGMRRSKRHAGCSGAKECNAFLKTMKTSEIIEKREDSSHFVLLEPNDVPDNLQITTNSKKEEPVEKLLI